MGAKHTPGVVPGAGSVALAWGGKTLVPAKRNRWGVLAQRDFRLLWVGETASGLGNGITTVALPLVAVIALQATALEVGLLAAAVWLPWLIVGLPPAPGSTGYPDAAS
ncbi:hypothetical protein SSP24_84030 [Streptomyces spinoverrucosus]|uniref:Uncharacterized protein n=1 Tax=Streptomyces spinoverrucosus TaxID=284043 RepID=A0A4Y3VWZ6_9ACTN|nr:hypothetical protein SSP24_84030 [Streptomyces spinoverrucosus]GHB71241.1 hypothetical protein GCM10010397_47020 [Streptomyces spinoverrucosus]